MKLVKVKVIEMCAIVAFVAASMSISCGRNPDGSSATAGHSTDTIKTSGVASATEVENNETTFETEVSPWVHTWESYKDMPECQHVEVESNCEDRWCRIPKGCFVMGSPEDEFGRSPILEDQLTVVLDQSFEMMQYEVTLGEWRNLGFQQRERHEKDEMVQPECNEDNCPADNISWWAAIAFANRLSENAGYSPCYVQEKCTGEVHEQEYTCESVSSSTPSLYECDGYRLPTEAEWEYAARAGTQTTYYAGPIQPSESTVECTYQPYLVEYAWYCYNSEKRAHPVGQKRPNEWGLYDMLGNLEEWANDNGNVRLPEGPVHNLNAGLDTSTMKTSRGGSYYSHPAFVTTSKRMGTSFGTTHTGFGFRLVRTLPE